MKEEEKEEEKESSSNNDEMSHSDMEVLLRYLK